MINFKKIFAYITFGLVIFTFFMSFIDDIITLVDLGRTIDTSFKTFTIWMIVIDLLASIAVCIVSGIGLYNYAKLYDYNENFIIAPIFIYSLASHLVDGITITYLKSNLSPGTQLNLSGIVITLLIFSILSFITCFIAMEISNSSAKKVLGISGFVFAFIYIIISLSQSSSNLTAFSIVVFVFLLLSIIVSGISLFAPDEGAYYSYSEPSSTTEISDDSIDESKNRNEGPDPYEQLIKLKKLYNQKIISKSEYETKKKKYTERL